jgi:hypothetical protein
MVAGGAVPCVVPAEYPCPLVLQNAPCSTVECGGATGDTCPGGATGYSLTNFTYKATKGAAAGQTGNEAIVPTGTSVTCQLSGPCASAGKSGNTACSAPQPNGKRYCLGGFQLPPNRYQVSESQPGGPSCTRDPMP